MKSKMKYFIAILIVVVLVVVVSVSVKYRKSLVGEQQATEETENESSQTEEQETAPASQTESTLQQSEYPKTMYLTEDVQITDAKDVKEATWKEDVLFDTALTVTDIDGDYAIVQLEDGRTGYVDVSVLTEVVPQYVDASQQQWSYSREGLSISIVKYREDNLTYWVADIITDNPDEDINTAFSGGSYEAAVLKKTRTSVLAKKNDAVFAVNGDACGFRPDGDDFQDPILIRNGQLYHEDDRNIGEMCALMSDGTLTIFSPGDWANAQAMIDDGVTDTWWFDTALVKNGEIPQALIDNESYFEKAPYTAIGQIDNNHFLFIVVDGRGSSDSEGVTYTGMARLMKRYGAVTAYELDGGGSSTIYFDGMVLNEPSDGRERAISDIIYVSR
jgi:hypothetical protein